jgi:DNA replication and repair protein RecF
MHIEKLSVINFKNYHEAEILCNPKLNCFVGQNGVGKTNMLDAIYYLCMSKSYFHGSDKYTIRNGLDFMVLQGFFKVGGHLDEIYCGLKTEKRKIFRKNKKEYPRISEHIGQYPVVMISPADSMLIIGGSDERRKYINAVISQYSRTYLENTIQYNKILLQRNKLLKNFHQTRNAGELLEVYNTQIAPLGNNIYKQRKEFIEKLSPVFNEFYKKISDNKEDVQINYTSTLHDQNFEELLQSSLMIDQNAQYTSQGIHKDDIKMVMGGTPIRKTGSQGQQKTFLVALKMAQFSFLKDTKGIDPILLLDDIFDKFDGNRVKHILELVSDNSFGQIFITHTNESRMIDLLSGYTSNYTIFRVAPEGIKQLENEEE